ncbi:UNVERIFIED_CONTAM: hypothetical protein K2H54_041673 [Gekko kuhli]
MIEAEKIGRALSHAVRAGVFRFPPEARVLRGRYLRVARQGSSFHQMLEMESKIMFIFSGFQILWVGLSQSFQPAR